MRCSAFKKSITYGLLSFELRASIESRQALSCPSTQRFLLATFARKRALSVSRMSETNAPVNTIIRCRFLPQIKLKHIQTDFTERSFMSPSISHRTVSPPVAEEPATGGKSMSLLSASFFPCRGIDCKKKEKGLFLRLNGQKQLQLRQRQQWPVGGVCRCLSAGVERCEGLLAGEYPSSFFYEF